MTNVHIIIIELLISRPTVIFEKIKSKSAENTLIFQTKYAVVISKCLIVKHYSLIKIFFSFLFMTIEFIDNNRKFLKINVNKHEWKHNCIKKWNHSNFVNQTNLTITPKF